MIQLDRYLERLQDTILSRREIVVEMLEISDRSRHAGRSSEFYARLRFHDDSVLQIAEKLRVEQFLIIKERYTYHYQTGANALIFRYDNAPHHSEISTHPHHKHINNQVIAANPPDLSDVLREIDRFLYPTNSGA